MIEKIFLSLNIIENMFLSLYLYYFFYFIKFMNRKKLYNFLHTYIDDEDGYIYNFDHH